MTMNAKHENPANFGMLYWRAVKLFPQKVAIQQPDAPDLIYADLEARTQRVVGLVRQHGLQAGQAVSVLLPNDYRFPEIVFGLARAGAIVVPVNIKQGDDTLAYIADHSDAVMLFAHADLLHKAQAMQAGSDAIKTAFIVGMDDATAASEANMIAYESALQAAKPDDFVADVDPEDVAMLMYTSGSTGRPKGCLLAHRSKWWSTYSQVRVMHVDEGDSALITGPLYHANAFWGAMLPLLYVGGRMAILSGFDAVKVLQAIDRYKPTYMAGTPSMYSLLLAAFHAHPVYAVSSLQFLTCGSAPVTEELLTSLQQTFGCVVVEGYGMTETGANIVTPRWGIKKLGSTGLPVPEAEAQVVSVDDESRLCAVGEIGELWSRGPANTLGYYKQPDVTAERITPDGWLKTRDLMSADEDGYFYFRGRKDDMINVGGENVYPKEIENVLLSHPAIADVAVVAAPHQVKGEAPVAWVVLRTDAEGSPESSEAAIKQFYLDRGPAYAHPRRVFFVDELPLTGTNKLDRQWLTTESARRIPQGIAGGQSGAN